MIPWLSSPQHCLLVKQEVAQQVHKLPTLHMEWTFILRLQAPWARSIPLATTNLMYNVYQGCSITLLHWVVRNDLLFHPGFLTYKAYNFWNHPCMLHALPIPLSQFCNPDMILCTQHFIMQCSALSVIRTQCTYFTKDLLFLNYKNCTCTFTCSRTVVW
jgi:hypothetical protein